MCFAVFFQQQLPMVFNASITGDMWKGEALLPWSFFPREINKMNSYAIHGSGAGRTYEALYPIPPGDLVPGQGPDLWEIILPICIIVNRHESDSDSAVRRDIQKSIMCVCVFSHRLEYFQPFSLQSIMGEGWVQPESDLWKGVSKWAECTAALSRTSTRITLTRL